MDFSTSPIIILGVNHSGTRVLVEILNRLGSNGGNFNNEWKENKFFLKLHKYMIRNSCDLPWAQAIFKLPFNNSFRDDLRFLNYLKDEIEKSLSKEFTNYESHLWHWKCPTSILFLNTWNKLFPNAYYINISRNDYDVAKSLLIRKQFYSINRALQFVNLLKEKVAGMNLKRCLDVKYEYLEDDIQKIIDFLPMNADNIKINSALSCIKRQSSKFLGWNKHYSLQKNMWAITVKSRISISRLIAQEFWNKI
jgi:hypothetical protein